MTTLFANLLTWIVQFALFVPFQILRLIGTLLPPCSSFGLVSFSAAVLNSAFNWIRFTWPVLQYVPWSFLWNLLAAYLLYNFFKWLWVSLPRIMHFVQGFWWMIVVFYVVAGFISVFLGDGWRTHSAFTEVFGTAPTSTGFVNGGAGGGGGGSW